MSPSDRKYSHEHEWVMLEDPENGHALAGITHYAQDQLGDIVFFELPKLGSTVTALSKMGEVESVKAVSDLFSPVSGEIIEVNERLVNNPELTNEDPFGEGWLVRVSLSNAGELNNLLSAEDYDEFVAGL